MIKLQRVLLSLLVFGGLVTFTFENWSPSVPLVIFSTKTIALPLSLWILAACLAGALTTVAIALCLRLLIHESHRPAKEDVQSFDSPMPQAPRQTTRRPNAESTQKDSAPQFFTSRFNPPKQSAANKAVVDVGMDDWEEFSRPREEWEDWQRSHPVVTEVDFDPPMSSGSRFGNSSRDTSRRAQASDPTESMPQQHAEFYEGDRPRTSNRRGYDAQGYDDGRYDTEDEGQRDDRRDRDRYEYSRNDEPQASYNAYDYGGPDRYPQDSQTGYGSPRNIRDEYATADYGGDRYDQNPYDQNPYDQNPYDQNPYEPEGYAQDQYGYDNSYGYPGRDGDYSQPNPAPPPNQSRDQNSAQNNAQNSTQNSSEQYIMDYGDEAALDAFDGELEATVKLTRQNRP